MSLILKNKLIFIHFPKTAGTFLSEMFEKNEVIQKTICFPEDQDTKPLFESDKTVHCNISTKKYSKQYKRFFFVRHPYSWYESYINFKLKDNCKKCAENYYFDSTIKDQKDINTILNTLEKRKQSPMTEMLNIAKQNVWKIFQYENFEKSIQELDKLLNIKINTQRRINATQHKRKLTPKNKQKIYNIEHSIFSEFKYNK